MAFLLVAAQCPAEDWSDTSPVLPNSMATPSGIQQQQSAVPEPPARPTQPSRPASWPGAPVDASGISVSNQSVPTADMVPCEGTRIVAHVGSEVILECDMTSEINEMIQMWVDKNKPDASPEEKEMIRSQQVQKALDNEAAMKMAVQGCVQTKLAYLDAKKSIPAEGWPQIEKSIGKGFEDTKIPALMKQMNAKSRAELDKKLREQGSSIERESRLFTERNIALGWKSQQIKPNKETTYDQLITYYQGHLDEFTSPPRVQWEELMVRFSNYQGNKAAAYEAIRQMGDAVWHGAPFADVAQKGSDGSTAADGGVWPWTNKGSQTCEAIEQALFTLPVGELSPILESPRGFHIIRVTQREDTEVKSFREAQVDIEKKIVQQRFEKMMKEYVTDLQAKTPVTTIFDDDNSSPQVTNRPPLRR